MSTFLQIFFINLVVSCDNVGVIALATKGLPSRKAATARRLGIWLSLLLKLLFVGIVGFLFRIPWLHIRIVGGLLLLYVTFNMLRSSQDSCHTASARQQANDNFFAALITIIAADVSMSLDNVLAILSIVSADGQPPNSGDMLLIFTGLLLCVPVLLWFSGTVSRLMERYALLTCLCGGYLAYIAASMIFEDEFMLLFFQKMNFHQSGTVALLIGGVVCIHAFVMTGTPPTSFKRRSALLAICSFVVIYALLSATVISYLETNPMLDGRTLSAELLYEFVPCGANAVFSIAAASELPVLCAAIYAGVLLDHNPDRSFPGRFTSGCRAMMLFLSLEIGISTLLLTTEFGFGTFRLFPYLIALLLQTGLLFTYVAVFTLIGSLVSNKGACIALGFLYSLAEGMIAALFMHHNSPLAGLLPTYYIAYFSQSMENPAFLARCGLLIILFLFICWLAGSGTEDGQRRPATIH